MLNADNKLTKHCSCMPYYCAYTIHAMADTKKNPPFFLGHVMIDIINLQDFCRYLQIFSGLIVSATWSIVSWWKALRLEYVFASFSPRYKNTHYKWQRSDFGGVILVWWRCTFTQAEHVHTAPKWITVTCVTFYESCCCCKQRKHKVLFFFPFLKSKKVPPPPRILLSPQTLILRRQTLKVAFTISANQLPYGLGLVNLKKHVFLSKNLYETFS